MPYRKLPGSTEHYFMLTVDDDGIESTGDPDATRGRISDDLIGAVSQYQATDLFIWIHGWKQGVSEAFSQFDSWIGAFAARKSDQALMQARRPDFKALYLGFHWPSLAWGEGELMMGDTFASVSNLPMEEWVEHYALQLGDMPSVRAALRELFDALRWNASDDKLTDTAREAYLELNAALALGNDGRPGDGSADRAVFDPDLAISDETNLAFGVVPWSNHLLSPLRQLTFWTMKKRAKTVGQQGLHPLLARLQSASPTLHIHLMGHSFGCIVASAAIADAAGISALPRAIDSCVLLQAAMSLWAFASSIASDESNRGYFESIVSDGKVNGTLIATRSKHDYALGRIYPWAAGVAGQDTFALPRYGAIGAFGICGTTNTEVLAMKGADETYSMLPGKIYNIDGSTYICKVDGVSGAHSDIAGPEVAHLIWQAALPREANHE